MQNALILAAVSLTAALLIWPRLANATLWRATITPLASIIGSGFLVLGPILNASFGAFAPLVMIGLCAIAYGFGSAIRFSIADMEITPPSRGITQLETAASLVLAFAFVVSVAYYLNLFGAFGVSLTELDDRFHAKLLTTATFAVILFTGLTRGFSALERLEQISVGLKLAIIAGLLVGLALYFRKAVVQEALVFAPPRLTGWAALSLIAGLLVTVQGFETSRYLGTTYDAATRIKSMRLAQLISAGIYILYIAFLTYTFDGNAAPLSETAIIDLMAVVAPILPLLLVMAALSAQFSAAIADTGGSGGLISEITRGVVTEKQAYVVLVGLGLLLTWTANIFEIISYASRAFALYYALQATIAAARAWRNGRRGKVTLFIFIGLIGAAAALFGTSVE